MKIDGVRQTREFVLDGVEFSERIVKGIGVPYGVRTDLGWAEEEFLPGSVDASGARLLYQHRETIGVVESYEDSQDGVFISCKVSKTRSGDEALELVKDGAIKSFSIGFLPDEYDIIIESGKEIIRHRKVKCLEFSLVTFPAYEDAKVTEIRGKKMNVEEILKKQKEAVDSQLRGIEEGFSEKLDLLERKFEMPLQGSSPAIPEYRSIGEFVQRLHRGDEEAAALYRDFTGGKISSTAISETWLGDFIKLATENRRYISIFSAGTLPPEGMSVEYGKLKSNSMNVTTQSSEGAALVSGKIELEHAQEQIVTKGGYFEVSQQVIDRAPETYLNASWEALALAYAKDTNSYAKAKIKAGISAAQKDPTALTLTAKTADSWVDVIVDASGRFDESAYTAEGLLVSADVFKDLAKMKDGDSRLMNVYGNGFNQFGELNLTGAVGNLAGVKVNVIYGETGLACFYDKLAFKTYENAGAPMKLQDENILNLSKGFSLYGYIAHINPHPNAIIGVKLPA